MNLADLRSRTRKRVDESGTPAAYSDAEVDASLNEGLRLFALLSLCVERTSVLKASPDRSFYQLLVLLADFLVPLRVRCHVMTTPPSPSEWDVPLWDSVLFDEAVPDAQITMTKVRPARLADLDALNVSWPTVRNATVQKYGCLGLDLLYIYPAPADTGTSLEITYAAEPMELTVDADVPDIPEAYHQALIHYAVGTLPMKFGGSELAQAADEFTRFLTLAEKCGETVRVRGKALQYDYPPFELKAWMKARAEAMAKKKRRPA